jgi:cell division septation protein DedD
MKVNRIVVSSVARLTQTKLSLPATFAITRSLFIALFITSAPVFADTLVVGSVYFDSEQTLKEVINLSTLHDNEGIAKLIQNGHISDQTREEKDIVVLISGSAPESSAEFRFLNGPTTYWTLTKNVTNLAKPLATSTPVPTPTSTPTPAPTESPTPTPTSEHHRRQHESNAPFDDDNGRRIWHQVDGQWKWYPANSRHVPVKKALPPDEAPLVKP